MKLQNIFPSSVWRRLAVAAALFVVPVVLFVQLAEEVADQETLGFDEAVLRAVNTSVSPGFDSAMIAITQLGGMVGVALVTTGLLVLLWQKRMRRMAVLLATGVGGAAAINVLLKTFFQRDRPELWERLVVEDSYSFPSGHAMASSALACSLVVIYWPTRWRYIVVAGATIYMVFVGLSRLYLGVHYPTDVVAGWLVSGAWIAVVTTALGYPLWSKTETKKFKNTV